MDAACLVLSAAQTLFAALKRSDLKELFSLFGYKSELEKLESTVSRVQAVLQDAEAKQELSKQEKDLVEKLRDAVYDADDLLDEFVTVAEQEKQRLDEKGSGVSTKVRNLFYRFEKLGVARTMSREVKRVRKTLDEIAKDATSFVIEVDNRPLRTRREETCSYVYEPEIIGREEDTRRIIGMLLDDPNAGKDVSFLTIIGIGGLGKTALAQLVYNHERVKKEFQLRLWTCVADQDQEHLDVKAVLGNILKSTIDEKHIDDLGMEQIQKKVRDNLDGKKYFLVLDDLWTESRGEWLKLAKFFMGGLKGSRIVVTTRSKGTATALQSDFTYELKGLSDQNSWHLFEVTVGHEQANHHDLVEMGRAIVKKCANVPLAVKVVGSLLCGQDKYKWRSLHQSRLTEIRNGKNDIMPILKFSYYQLSPSLKSCFSYCALFPKDFIIRKEMLVSLWMAQAYIEPLDGGQGIEDAAEEHFLILLRRCFFQDVKKDMYGEVDSFKIHDLMHDIAQEVVGKEICVVSSTMSDLHKKCRHMSEAPFRCTESFFTNSNIRTYLHKNSFQRVCEEIWFPVGALLASFTLLRAMDLSNLMIKSLPDSIGNLLHLRYLDLSGNREIEMLPRSITKLHNLQTLILGGCRGLKELPKDLSKLINLRLLDIYGCDGLSSMPSGMEKLTCLQSLTMFVVAGKNSSLQQHSGWLGDLRALRNLKGHLTIVVKKDYKHVRKGRGGYLSNKEHLTDIRIKFEGRADHDEELLEDLQPHCNLKGLRLEGYNGVRTPMWIRDLATFFRVEKCDKLDGFGQLSKLCCLKNLHLRFLLNLEYVEDVSYYSSVSYTAAASTLKSGSDSNLREAEMEIQSSFFPSLEDLSLDDLPNLKGWWRGCGSEGGADDQDQLVDTVNSSITQPCRLPFFPHLSSLVIARCPNLTSIPLCSTVEMLILVDLNQRLRLVRDETEESSCTSLSLLSFSPTQPLAPLLDSEYKTDFRLRDLTLDDVGYVKSLPLGAFQHLTRLSIYQNEEEQSSSEIEELFLRCSSSLQLLCIYECSQLRYLCEGFQHLSALESLELFHLPNLSFKEEEKDTEEDRMPWRSLAQSLRSLELHDLGELVNLPKGMRHLTSLQSLIIRCCPLQGLPDWISCFSSLQFLRISNCNLESLPEGMAELTSLKRLEIWDCPEILGKRCREPDGEDWPKIQHIPDTFIKPSPLGCYFNL